ncbi:hypothetical protein FNW02_06470 [Komarekiella sp. 'clone 1']|uniref:Uncharacterized protein n=1 Tax=Komarekiella delphini-convector SJRDD-AB1 TaxID=2593771 RepID=A0AA40SV43_9NOST|nr:hypothetical protein [Komarekiella delphini-convector]MBD6615490.1 hypothetical protein [Komarekiella delphini-convector SJRDD-AB1]
MNKTLITTVVFALLVSLIISPFAALASLMFILLIAAFFLLLGNLFQTITGGDPDLKINENKTE